MSAEINNGGSAFPQPAKHYDDGSSSVPPNNGMSLRDWFAGKALAAMLSHNGGSAFWDRDAKNAYAAADAMIAAREEKP